MTKVMRVMVSELIQKSDLIIYAEPTRNIYSVTLKDVILDIHGYVSGQHSLTIEHPPQSVNPGGPSELTFEGLKQPGIIFLQRPNRFSGKYRLTSYCAGWIPLQHDRVEGMGMTGWNKVHPKVLSYVWYVDYNIIFPGAANPKNHRYLTRQQISRFIQQSYKKPIVGLKGV